MIDVQVGAKDDVDILDRNAGRGEIIEIRQVEHVKPLEDRQRTRLAVARAGVDEDGLAVDLEQP